MRYLSVCSGIEAATVAWGGLGWEPAAFSEIENFPSDVLAHHYPDVPNLGDMTKYKEWDIGSIGLLVGGTPCQSFSVAGLRKGLDDPRGNLALVYCGILDRFKPKWFVWENVPGVLSSSGGRDFGSFLGAVAELGYGWAYRVLDAQYFGVAQRRRRVFVVGCLGDWRSAAAVLFERQSLSGDPPPSREKRQGITCTPEGISGAISRKWSKGTGGPAGDEHYNLMVVHGTQDPITSNVAFPLATNQGQENAVVYEMHGQDSRVRDVGEVCTTVTQKYGTGGGNVPVTISYRKSRRAQSVNDHETWVEDDVTNTINVFDVGDVRSTQTIVQSMMVRRLTPVECERLQGFPDHYTDVKDKTPDGPRYKALGNSMAVPVMTWIGQRIKEVDELSKQKVA